MAGTVFQTAVTVLVIALPALFPVQLASENAYEAVAIIAPQTMITLPQAQPVVPVKAVSTTSTVEEPLPPQSVVRLTAPRPLVPTAPKPAPVDSPAVPVLNEISTEAKFEAPPSEPARPREPVKTGGLSAANAGPATINKPPEQVQTGGFGENNGLSAESSGKRGNVPRSGFPELPPGPGYGNGSAGLNGVRGVVTRAGFGDDPVSPVSKGSAGVVKPGGFETATAGSATPKPPKADAPGSVQPVIILAKPDPAYSNEARRLGLEGEVLVEVIFLAKGGVRVLRVTQGLGHGLDEAAVHAAEQIQFKPALQDGKPVDFLATVRIQFELAF